MSSARGGIRWRQEFGSNFSATERRLGVVVVIAGKALVTQPAETELCLEVREH